MGRHTRPAHFSGWCFVNRGVMLMSRFFVLIFSVDDGKSLRFPQQTCDRMIVTLHLIVYIMDTMEKKGTGWTIILKIFNKLNVIDFLWESVRADSRKADALHWFLWKSVSADSRKADALFGRRWPFSIRPIT